MCSGGLKSIMCTDFVLAAGFGLPFGIAGIFRSIIAHLEGLLITYSVADKEE